MKLTRHNGNIGIYYTTTPDIHQSNYLVRRDPTVKQRRYTVSRRRTATNGVVPLWDWEIVHDALTINDARAFITADQITMNSNDPYIDDTADGADDTFGL